ncbi:MAG: hypothetical protein QM504_17400, partial [Pseudomonadota bacterium]
MEKIINKIQINNLIGLFLFIGLLIGIYMLLQAYGFIDLITDTEQFKAYILHLGNWGILLVISLMAFAILFKF